MTTATLGAAEAAARYHTDEYNGLVALMQRRFDRLTNGAPVFKTDAGPAIWDAYLASFPEADRQYHNCSCCRRFVTRFGGLVVIDEDGQQKSAIWPNEVDAKEMAYYGNAVNTMRKLAKKGKVISLFLSSEVSLGYKEAGGWTHFAVIPDTRFQSLKLTAGQKMAEKREDYKTMKTALAEYPLAALVTLMKVINSEQLPNTETIRGPSQWLHDLQARLSSEKVSKVRDNILWRAIATAPDAFCHPRSSMTGTLLADIINGLGFEALKVRYAEKMHPLQYQRPQAPPTEGNIANAEKLIEKLGVTNSLRRRWANESDILERLWQPREAQAPKAEASSGVFDHLKGSRNGKAQSFDLNIPATTMTWDKFQRTVLPNAEKIELQLTDRHYAFAGLLTAADPDAPPILRWDTVERRNPVSWYLYDGDNQPKRWGLDVGTYAEVTSIIANPSTWGGSKVEDFAHQVFFVINGASDAREASLCLFPQILKSDLREARATIEAHSNSRKAEKTDEPQVCGLMLQGGARNAWNYVLRVTSKGTQQNYCLDRWD